jgi:hypothetical protein
MSAGTRIDLEIAPDGQRPKNFRERRVMSLQLDGESDLDLHFLHTI